MAIAISIRSPHNCAREADLSLAQEYLRRQESDSELERVSDVRLDSQHAAYERALVFSITSIESRHAGLLSHRLLSTLGKTVGHKRL